MASARDDYLLRMIAEAAASLRRLRGRLGSGESVETVRHDADDAIGLLLGPQRETLEHLDAWSAVNLLGDASRTSAWLDLLELQADTHEAQENTAGARALRERVAALRAHQVARSVASP